MNITVEPQIITIYNGDIWPKVPWKLDDLYDTLNDLHLNSDHHALVFLVRGNASSLVPPLSFCLAGRITLLFYKGVGLFKFLI